MGWSSTRTPHQQNPIEDNGLLDDLMTYSVHHMRSADDMWLQHYDGYVFRYRKTSMFACFPIHRYHMSPPIVRPIHHPSLPSSHAILSYPAINSSYVARTSHHFNSSQAHAHRPPKAFTAHWNGPPAVKPDPFPCCKTGPWKLFRGPSVKKDPQKS